MHKNEQIFDKIYGAWTGMIAGNNNGLFFENKYQDQPVEEHIDGILTSVNRYQHTDWAFNVYDILLRYGGMADDDTLMEWLMVEEILKLGRYPTLEELGQVWVKNLNYRNFGEGRHAIEQFAKGVKPPEHLDIDSGIPLTEYFKDWGICALIYNEILGILTYRHPETVRSRALEYGSMVNRREGCEGAVFGAALQNAAMRMDRVTDIIEYALSELDHDAVFSQEVERAYAAARANTDWKQARKDFLSALPEHHIADAIPNAGLVLLALYFGKGDFAETMSLSIQLGYDTDCNACTVGGVMGAVVGEKAIPESWKGFLNGIMVNMIWDKWDQYDGCQRYEKYAFELPEKISIKELAEKTMKAAEIVSK